MYSLEYFRNLFEFYSKKIADFGLAKQLVTHGQSNFTMVGTPNFLAPEIATRKTHSFEADIWSLGALIYQCLVGKPPFDDQGCLFDLFNVKVNSSMIV